jgi:stage II sporulation protein GA (sporulation sigma-E factor processing peptidase)
VYYEIFIDVLFAKNFIMDFFLLRLVNRLLHGSATLWRSLLGACMGAIGICLIAVCPGSRLLNTILVHVVVNTMMVRFGCNIKKSGDLFQGICLLYTAGFLSGGAMQLLLRYTGLRGVRIFILSGTISYLFLAASIRVYARAEKKADRSYTVRLYANGKCKEGMALMDTGNSLLDPLSGKPVSIVNMQMLEGLLSEKTRQQLENFLDGTVMDEEISDENISLYPHYIPFSSLGCAQGILMAVTLDYMCLESRKIHKVITSPVIAFSRENNSFCGDYQMILHPNLIDS